MDYIVDEPQEDKIKGREQERQVNDGLWWSVYYEFKSVVSAN